MADSKISFRTENNSNQSDNFPQKILDRNLSPQNASPSLHQTVHTPKNLQNLYYPYGKLSPMNPTQGVPLPQSSPSSGPTNMKTPKAHFAQNAFETSPVSLLSSQQAQVNSQKDNYVAQDSRIYPKFENREYLKPESEQCKELPNQFNSRNLDYSKNYTPNSHEYVNRSQSQDGVPKNRANYLSSFQERQNIRYITSTHPLNSDSRNILPKTLLNSHSGSVPDNINIGIVRARQNQLFSPNLKANQQHQSVVSPPTNVVCRNSSTEYSNVTPESQNVNKMGIISQHNYPKQNFNRNIGNTPSSFENKWKQFPFFKENTFNTPNSSSNQHSLLQNSQEKENHIETSNSHDLNNDFSVKNNGNGDFSVKNDNHGDFSINNNGNDNFSMNDNSNSDFSVKNNGHDDFSMNNNVHGDFSMNNNDHSDFSVNNNVRGDRLSPLGSDSVHLADEEKIYQNAQEKLEIFNQVSRKNNFSEITPTAPVNSPDCSKPDWKFNNFSRLRSSCGRPAGRSTPESTDCGSTLSKSSSDGEHMMNRRRPISKFKSKRRNILSFPQHLSTNEIQPIQHNESFNYAESSSDENRSSGHASMSSDGHTSSSPPVDTLPRHHHVKTPLKSVPENERLWFGASSNSAVVKPPIRLKPQITSNHFNHHQRVNSKDSASDLSLSLESASGLDDIKNAIEQLTIRSQGSRTSYATSTYSSVSGSEAEPSARKLVRHSSLDTINTNVTSADEFVWVDSHNRLVELQQLPWSNHDVLRLIQQGRVREHLDRVSMEAIPRLSYLLQRALVRVAREAQRLTRPLAMCSKREISSAFKIVLTPSLADSCIKSCLRAAAMYTVFGGDQTRQAKSTRAGLKLSVSRFMRWMCDVRLGKFIHEYAAVYMTGGMENLLEEMILQSLPRENEQMLTAAVLEHAIANNGDFWGLLQPYAHLNAGRTATGALCMPQLINGIGMERVSNTSNEFAHENSPNSSTINNDRNDDSCVSAQSRNGRVSTSSAGSTPVDVSVCHSSRSSSSMTITPDDRSQHLKTMEQTLLTTCVGSLSELTELVNRIVPHIERATNYGSNAKSLYWGPSALHSLFYFMRCSQLEHAEHISRAPIQELVYERPYIVLPPLVEWVRVASAHAEHRQAVAADKDDVLQAARLLLPGVDCPIRMIGFEELSCAGQRTDDSSCAEKLKVDLAFKMLSCARSDLVSHALQIMPATKVNTVNEYGLTPLMMACIRGEEAMVSVLLDTKADVDVETPPAGSQGSPHTMANPETQHWTALTYAAIHGHTSIARILLEKKCNVEGGARLSEEKCTETPLQVASAAGHLEMMSLLLSHGSNPYLSTLMKDSLCYSAAAQRGCYSAICVAAAHGQRVALHKLLSQPQRATSREVLSLEEILAEGVNTTTENERKIKQDQNDKHTGAKGSFLLHPTEGSTVTNENSAATESTQVFKLTKQQIKTLQEAMYHSAESGHLEMTLDVRNLGVPWTLHSWMHTLATAHKHHLDSIIDQLLQDFLQDWPEDYSTQFVDECLPLLFTIFRYSKNEGTSLLLADIFSICFGKEEIRAIQERPSNIGARIDPKFVNNPELSDVQFRLEGRVFYGHKIILVNASPRFRQMLTSNVCESTTPVIQIHDIRYHIFELVMHSLYKGGCENLEVDTSEVLELMAAANFFQLESLLRYCEMRCSQLVRLENVVSMYVHSKVYGASELLEYCHGFLLQNMVALLTYDDSVRRLIFGKKLHNHDILAGILSTLQHRINSRSSPRAGKK